MVSKLEELTGAKCLEVALPGFVMGEPFVVKLRRPSLMRLAQEGKIPNQLLGAAATLFDSGMSRVLESGEKFVELSGAVICLAKSALVEPTYEELEEAGIRLTDEQLYQIYLYSQKGVQSLEGFRKEQESDQDIESGGKPEQTTE